MILLGDAAVILNDFNDCCIDLTVTSPPYDNLRTYGGHSFNFEAIAKELYRVTKDGGVVVWIIGDQTKDGDESGTSFEQALYFKQVGFKLVDTMIYDKGTFRYPDATKYYQSFEYMFILSKGKPKTFNPIKDRPVKQYGENNIIGERQSDGSIKKDTLKYKNRFGVRLNIWRYLSGFNLSTMDEIAFEHPAIMPEQLAIDHIKSWSNEGDLILDPFAGSGTTLKAAHLLRREWVGIEINSMYVQLAKKRLTPYIQQQRLEQFPLENVSQIL